MGGGLQTQLVGGEPVDVLVAIANPDGAVYLGVEINEGLESSLNRNVDPFGDPRAGGDDVGIVVSLQDVPVYAVGEPPSDAETSGEGVSGLDCEVGADVSGLRSVDSGLIYTQAEGREYTSDSA